MKWKERVGVYTLYMKNIKGIDNRFKIWYNISIKKGSERYELGK